MINEDFQLQGFAKNLAMEKWGMKFNGKIRLSEKLLPLRQYGRYVPESNTIYIASQLFLNESRSAFAEWVVLHELCHWYKYQKGEEYHDGTVEFENFLREHQAITNGNYPHTEEHTAFADKIQVMRCSKCDKPQFDNIPNTRNVMVMSKCCSKELVGDQREMHSYKYYRYK